MKLTKKQKAMLDKSYQSYRDMHDAYKDKGYFIAKPLSKREYKNTYKNALSLHKDTRNWARQMANDDLAITRSRAKEVYRRLGDSLEGIEIKKDWGIRNAKELLYKPGSTLHEIIGAMFDDGLITDREEFNKSLGY